MARRIRTASTRALLARTLAPHAVRISRRSNRVLGVLGCRHDDRCTASVVCLCSLNDRACVPVYNACVPFTLVCAGGGGAAPCQLPRARQPREAEGRRLAAPTRLLLPGALCHPHAAR
eukprot:6173745-Pleurochrysis_carterae.AAC.1